MMKMLLLLNEISWYIRLVKLVELIIVIAMMFFIKGLLWFIMYVYLRVYLTRYL